MTNANEITFGIEIESLVPRTANIVGNYSRPGQVVGLPTGWVAKSDSSIRSQTGYRGVEFVSPVLKGAEGLRQIVAVCDQLKTWGVKVNRSTGLHVHVGFDRTETKSLKNLMHLVSHHEQAIFATTGTTDRENGRWSKSIKENFASVAKNPTVNKMLAHNYRGPRDRYHVLNVTNLINRTRPTVEFRAFAGTTKAVKILGYVRMCVALVQKAGTMKRSPAWNAKSNVTTIAVYRKSGTGSTAYARLCYAIGWTKGREARTFGNLEHETAPSLSESKKELGRLARKYDTAKSAAA